MSLCLNDLKTDWGEAGTAEPRSVFFIGFCPILPGQIQLANKMVRLIQYEGKKFGQCGPLTTQDGQV